MVQEDIDFSLRWMDGWMDGNGKKYVGGVVWCGVVSSIFAVGERRKAGVGYGRSSFLPAEQSKMRLSFFSYRKRGLGYNLLLTENIR